MNYPNASDIVPLLDDAVAAFSEAGSVAVCFGNPNEFPGTSWCICGYLINSGVADGCRWRVGPSFVRCRGTVDGPGKDGDNGGVGNGELHSERFVCLLRWLLSIDFIALFQENSQ